MYYSHDAYGLRMHAAIRCDDRFQEERTTFGDGATVTIDREAGTFEIEPPLELAE